MGKSADRTPAANRTAGTGLEKLTVISQESTAPGAFVLRFPKRAPFRAGQMVALTTDPAAAPRYYSIASGEDEPFIEVLYTVVEEGELTPRLSSLREGDALYVSAPTGEFVDRPGPAWWIAAGTGVAPFVSMVRSGLTEEKLLVHGARTPDGFHYAGLLSRALGNRYVRCCSGGTASGLYAGRLTAWLSERGEFPPEAMFFLCGGSSMVVDVRDILIGRGVRFDRIVSEIYF